MKPAGSRIDFRPLAGLPRPAAAGSPHLPASGPGRPAVASPGASHRRRAALGLALVLAASFAACGRDGPTQPVTPGRVALRLDLSQLPAAAVVDTVEASVFVGARRIAGPVITVPDDAGGFRLSLPDVQAGAERRAAVRIVAHPPPGTVGGLAPGTWYLGLSKPFSLAADDTITAPVTVEPFTTAFIGTQSTFVGSATLRWRRVANATGYRLREYRGQTGWIDRSATDTTLTVFAEAGLTSRTFVVRPESPWATGVWSLGITIGILEEEEPPQSGNWVALDQGQTMTPGARIYHAGAFHAASRSLFVFGGLGGTSELADSLLWVFSLAGGTWSTPSANAPVAPAPRINASLAVSADGSFVYLFGGQTADGSGLLDLWRFDQSTQRWVRLGGDAEAREGELPGAAGVDGFIWAPPGAPVRVGLYSPETAEVFTFNVDGRTWGPGAWSDMWVPERGFPACVFDAEASLLDTYGGLPGDAAQADSSLWVRHELEGGRWDRPAYGSGSKPPSRQMAALTRRDNGHLVLFGGIGPWSGQIPIFDDVWEFTPTVGANAGTWSRVDAGGSIGVRFRPTLGYDPTTHRLITFGGMNEPDQARVWALTLQ